MRKSFLLATIGAAVVLLPLSLYGRAAADDGGSVNSGNVQSTTQDAADDNKITFDLVPASDQIASCFPNATAKVKVLLTADQTGTDTFSMSAKGLRPNTTFAVFFTELPVAPFGAVQYVADLNTNANGRGSVEVHAIVGEAFSSQVVNGQRVRKELNNVVMWFAD